MRPSPSHGGVDRNADVLLRDGERSRRPLTGAWIETASSCARRSARTVALSRGRGSKLFGRQLVTVLGSKLTKLTKLALAASAPFSRSSLHIREQEEREPRSPACR